ncbi:hypothetical protein FRC07_000632 [Ceratobasidium sp. 392]|nr:hypothetical protein FRC07_000632 [Ceratobasidium sp. 392]
MELLFAAPVPCFLDNISNEAGKPQGTPASKRASHAISHLDIQAVAQVQGTQAKEDIETRENTQAKEVTPAQAALQTIVEDPEDIQPYQNAQFLESTQLQEGSLDTLPYLPSTLSIVSYASSTTRLWARTMADWMETSPVASPLIDSSDYPTSWDVVGMTSNPGSPSFNMCEFNPAPLRIVKRKRDAKDLHPDTASSTNNDLSRALVLYSPPSVLSPFKPQRHASILDVLSPIRVDDTVKPGLVPTAPNDNPVACLEDHAPSLAQLASSLTLAFETLEIANNTGAVTMTPILTMSPSLGDGFDLGIDLCSSTPAMDSTPGMFAASVAPLNILKRTCETTKQKEGRPLDGAESVEIACPVDTSSPMDLTTSGEPAFTRDRAIEFLDYPRPPSSSGSNDSSIGVQTHVDAKVGLKKVLRRGVHNLKSIFDFKGKMANTSREPTPSLTYDSRDTSVEPSNVGTPDLSATNPILGYPGLDTSESYSIRSRGEIQNKETRPCKRKVKFPLLDTPNTIGDAVEQRLNRMILTSHRRNISIHRT